MHAGKEDSRRVLLSWLAEMQQHLPSLDWVDPTALAQFGRTADAIQNVDRWHLWKDVSACCSLDFSL